MRRPQILPLAALAAVLPLATSGCLIGHKNLNPLVNVQSVQPDKVLFDRAMKDISAGKYTVGRLALQTLINAYPDSEYLASAKLAIANSWYREGGTEGLAQAEAEYRDFITFFPTMPEAREAQLKIAQIHFRQMQKPDRDPTQALDAQRELRNFLVNFPPGPGTAQAQQMLREVDEVLADSEFRVGSFYFLRGKYRAAQSRLQDVVNKYPLYSRGDEALAMLARSYLITSHDYAWAVSVSANPLLKNLYLQNERTDRESAAEDYKQLVERFPLSPEVRSAERELAALRTPIPKPAAEAIAFNRKEIEGRSEPSRLDRWTGMLRGAPLSEMARADRIGNPPLSDASGPPPSVAAELSEIIGSPGAGTSETASAATSPGSGGVLGSGLQFQSVGSNGFQDPNNVTTPTATVATDVPKTAPNGMNPGTVTATTLDDPPAAGSAGNVPLTPDEIDHMQQQQMLSAEVRRDVPYPHKLKKPKKGQTKKPLVNLPQAAVDPGAHPNL